MHSLPLFHRVAGRTVLVTGDPALAEPKRRLVERAGGIVVADPDEAIAHGARLAFVALADPEAAEAMAARLRGAGLLVNVVDRPELCDFTTPSILERDPLLVAVATGGASAGLAKQVRLLLERVLPPRLGELARALSEARDQLRARFPDGAERRRALDGALGLGGMLNVADPQAADRVDAWLADTPPVPAPRRRHIALRSADPDDLTIGEARWLGEADVVVAGPEVPPIILARARADAQRLAPSTPAPADTGLAVIYLAMASPGHSAASSGPSASEK